MTSASKRKYSPGKFNSVYWAWIGLSNVKSKHVDPMLLPVRDPKKRAEELRLLKEWELAGKIKRIDAVEIDRKDVAFSDGELLEEIGNDNGNFRVMTISELTGDKPKGER